MQEIFAIIQMSLIIRIILDALISLIIDKEVNFVLFIYTFFFFLIITI